MGKAGVSVRGELDRSSRNQLDQNRPGAAGGSIAPWQQRSFATISRITGSP